MHLGALSGYTVAITADRRREEQAELIERRYHELWDELTKEEEFRVEEMWRIQSRIERLNDLGFDVEEIDIVTDFDGDRVRIQPKVVELGHHQRELQALSMRQFARMVGISNPYLSQIERGLRKPSEQVLQGIADSLQTSVDVLYEQAGVPHDEDGAEPAVLIAIRADPDLSARQRSALIEIYESFTGRSGARRRRSASARARAGAAEASDSEAPRDS